MPKYGYVFQELYAYSIAFVIVFAACLCWRGAKRQLLSGFDIDSLAQDNIIYKHKDQYLI